MFVTGLNKGAKELDRQVRSDSVRGEDPMVNQNWRAARMEEMLECILFVWYLDMSRRIFIPVVLNLKLKILTTVNSNNILKLSVEHQHIITSIASIQSVIGESYRVKKKFGLSGGHSGMRPSNWRWLVFMLREMEMAHSGMKMQISEIYHIDADGGSFLIISTQKMSRPIRKNSWRAPALYQITSARPRFLWQFRFLVTKGQPEEVDWLNKLKICEMLALHFPSLCLGWRVASLHSRSMIFPVSVCCFYSWFWSLFSPCMAKIWTHDFSVDRQEY